MQKNILDIIPLNNTYYHEYTGNLGVHKKRVHEFYLFYNDDPLNLSMFDVGWCNPILGNGVANSAGGILSTNEDMHFWYQIMLHPNVPIPPVFKTPEVSCSVLILMRTCA